MRFFSKLSIVIIFICSFLVINKNVFAQDFQLDYKVEYYLTESNNSPLTDVKFRIDIKNNTSDTFIRKFSLTFPESFKIKNPSAIYNVPITPSITTSDKQTKVEVELEKGENGISKTSTVFINFQQEGIFKIQGAIWEVILPTLDIDEGDTYQVTLHLPEDNDKKLSISKPKPTQNSGKTITWVNPTNKTIYATFGTKQLYNIKLKYHLKNDEIRRVYTDVAFPPDALYQKVFVQSIEPKPSEFFTDEDGNYIGRYIMWPKEQVEITFNGVVELSSEPRDEVQKINTTQLQSQKEYLLKSTDYWNADLQSHSNNVKSIYDYVVDTFKYDVSKLEGDNKRLGAKEALKNPSTAVCTEFTDTFVSLARQKGIYAREIEGYGVSNDQELRPLSLKSDVLHSWPEYYSEELNEWVPVDPTWENTSGIDYFSSFDFNHIALAIHGKDSVYPLPGGMYKVKDSKDVTVSQTAELPTEKGSVAVSSFPVAKRLFGGSTATSVLTVENKSNVYQWDIPIEINSSSLNIKNPKQTISVLAPYEKKELSVTYTVPKIGTTTKSLIKVTVNEDEVFSSSIEIIPYFVEIGIKALTLVLVLTTIGLAVQFLYKRLKKTQL